MDKKVKKTTKPQKKVPKKQNLKVTKITTEKEFQDSLPGIKKAPFAVLDITRSIICATMYCECGDISSLRLQGPKGTLIQCGKCGTVYSLNEYLGVTKLTEAQKLFLKEKRQIDLL